MYSRIDQILHRMHPLLKMGFTKNEPTQISNPQVENCVVIAKESNDVLLSVVFGSLSGSLSSILLQPLDRLKTLVQQDATAHVNPFKHIKKVVQSHGFFDLWRGTTPTLLRVVPGLAVYFGCLEVGRKVMPYTANIHLANFMLGALSRTSAVLLVMPATVIKTRFESTLYRDAGVKAAARELLHQHGCKGLYRGTVPTLLRDAAFSGVFYTFYRQNLRFFRKDDVSRAPAERFICGIIAGICACAVTQPFDMVKTRVQIYSKQSFRGVISELYNRKGLVAFFGGFWLRAMRRTLMAALSWTFFDELIVERQQHR